MNQARTDGVGGHFQKGGIQMKRGKQILGFVLIVLGLFLGVSPVQAQSYPNRPIQVVISGAPGDAVDMAGRLMAEDLGKILKVSVVTLNKPGGGASVGTDFVAKSKKDGYTILYTPSSGVIYNPAFNPETTPYDPLRDLEPLGLHVSFPDAIWVKAESPWKTFSEVIDYAKKNPGKFQCATMGVGSINHFRLEIIKSLTGADITMLPFKGATPALTALLGGHTDSCFTSVPATYPHYKSGVVRGILLDQKVAELPEIPTLQQLGYKRGLPLTFFAFFAPAGIPEEAKNVLILAIEKAAKNPEMIGKLQKIWFIPSYKSAIELRHILSEDYENARQVVKQMGLTK
jgi:tripartite-type tricarboxylate transporter receptor subunit TctC